ncbi:TetR/AcrR family transcriptional regulator [Tsukamurella hominis]|uniref:TetR/AcrR family transcriptional regulator n=1 Tax=Tsukamurella hominis TaxID=1970232 RepID=UPI0039E776B4
MAPRADAVRNRQKLLDAAMRLFAAHGIDVPLDRIAKEAGVSIGTLYNNFPDRGALLDELLPERLAELERLAGESAAESDPWTGFTGFLEAMFAGQATDRAANEAMARGPLGDVDLMAECGRSGSAVRSVLDRAHAAGVVRLDFDHEDLGALMVAVAAVIHATPGDDRRWRRHLGFQLDGVRARRGSDA